MATPKIALACNLVNEDFGHTTKIVCQVLLERGTSTLDEIGQSCSLEKSLIRDGLLVAIQHNIVQVIEETINIVSKSRSATNQDRVPTITTLTKYHALIQNMLIRIRFSKFALQIREKYGHLAEQLLIRLLLLGRAKVSKWLESISELSHDQLDIMSNHSRNKMKLAYLGEIQKLKDNHFIIAVPEPSSSHESQSRIPGRLKQTYWYKTKLEGDDNFDLDSTSTSSSAVNKKNAAKKTKALAKRTSDADWVTSRSKRAAMTDPSSFESAPELKIYQDASMAQKEQTDNQSSTLTSHHQPFIATNTFNTVPSSISASPAVTTPLIDQTSLVNNHSLPSTLLLDLSQDETQWCVNYDQFNFEACKDSCTSLVEQKIDACAGIIIREMFNMAEHIKLISQERLFQTLTSQDRISTDPILEKMTPDRLKNYLDLMSKDGSQILTKIMDPPGFLINIQVMVKMIQERMIQSIILDKFGKDCLRIFRLLTMKKFLEQKQVSELAMIPIKETRDCLYKMLSHNCIHLQEVPRTNEHKAEKMFYLWSVQWQYVVDFFTTEIYKVMKNMLSRMRFTLELHQELIYKKMEEERTAQDQDDNGGHILLTEEERLRYDELIKIRERLQVSILQLDNTLITLVDF